jgi:hypothetical protein
MQLAPVALLVIRAWPEEGSERPLRIEIRLTADTGRGFEREVISPITSRSRRLVHLARRLTCPPPLI